MSIPSFRSLALVTAALFSALTASAQSRALILSDGSGTTYNTFTGYIGTAIQPTSNFTVTALGREYIAGNSGTHTVKIVDANTNLDVPGASVQITMTGPTSGTYQYVNLPSPVTLGIAHLYYLVSQETSGGDSFYDYQAVNGGQSIITGAVSTDNSGNYVVKPNSVWPVPNSQIAYLGPNMIFSVATSNLPTVTVTSPTNGQVVTTSDLLLTANVNPPLAGGQFVYFGYLLDGQTFSGGQYVLSPNYQLDFDPTTLLTGQHTVTATLTNPGVSSAPVTFSVPAGAYPLVTSQTPGPLRNNFTGYVGMQFTTGNHILQVNGFGRFVFPGNSSTHVVKLVDGVTGLDMVTNSTLSPVNTATATPGQFAYTYIVFPTTPIYLQPNHAYFLVSQETAGGDKWGDYGPVNTSNIAVNGPVYQVPNQPYQFVPIPGMSFVPVNISYKDLGPDAPPLIQVTSPSPGALPSATINVTGTITYQDPGPLNSYVTLQVLIDGKAVGSPVNATVATFSLPLDVTTISSGNHTLAVQSTDQLGGVSVSPGIAVQVNNFLGTALVVADSPTFLRNNYSGFVGMEFTVGSTPIQVSSLGRYCVASFSTSTHAIKLVQASTGTDVPGATASINLNGCAPGVFAYTQLASPVTLPAAGVYYLVDQETAGGDYFYDYSPVTASSAAKVNGAVYFNGATYVLVPGGPASYGPLNLLYTTGTLGGGLNVSIVSEAYNSVTVAATSSSPITSIQVLLDGFAYTPPLTAPPYTQNIPPSNFGTHAVSAVAKDAAGDVATSAPFSFTNPTLPYVTYNDLVSNNTGLPRNNYTGWVGFQITTTNLSLPIFYANRPGAGLGRTCVAGNTQSHLVKIVTAIDGADLPGASVVINCASALASGGTTYGQDGLDTLLPNTTYYVVTQETLGGDTFPDLGPIGAGSLYFSVDGPVYFDGQKYVLVPIPGYSIGGAYLTDYHAGA